MVKKGTSTVPNHGWRKCRLTCEAVCHAPCQVPTKYRDMYPALPANQSQRCFNALVSAMDESVGTIVDALKATAMYVKQRCRILGR